MFVLVKGPRAAPLAFFTALLTACGATYPKYSVAEPIDPARLGAPTPIESVRLIVAPVLRMERCGSRYLFRLTLRLPDLAGNLEMGRANDTAAGESRYDVRSANVYLTSDEKSALERAWWRPADWPPPRNFFGYTSSCARYGEALEEREHEDTQSTTHLVQHALDDLRRRAARAGAAEIDDVRCYVGARPPLVFPRRSWLWCEGVARGR